MMQQTIDAIAARGKGILAADESTGTMGKRLKSIGLENEEDYRRQFRSLLATTPKLGDHISGVILFEETFHQKDDHGENIAKTFEKNGIIPGIKVDKGLIPLAGTDEKTTQGLDSLPKMLEEYKALGAKFAKWRAVYQISDVLPSDHAMHVNACSLARYAKICQSFGIVPIVEPEVLMDGSHTLARCEQVTEAVLKEVFSELDKHEVELKHIILKPNMVISGQDCPQKASSKEIAEATLRVFHKTVPHEVPTINFLSGGQTEEEATENLKTMNQLEQAPWYLSFSYGRALQASALKAWAGKDISAGQKALFERARLNGEAAAG